MMMSFTFLNVPTVWAEPFTIYIRADGSIDPPTANITTVDNFTYTFTALNSGGIKVEKDNIVLDGASYVLQGIQNWTFHEPDPNGTVVGVNLSGRNNVTVQNLIIVNVPFGIELFDATNCTIRENMFNTDGPWSWDANVLLSGYGNTVVENTFYGWVGVDLREGSRNSILRNQFNLGIAIQVGTQAGWSSNNVIAENNFPENTMIEVESSSDTFYHNNFYPGTVGVAYWSESNWNETYPAGGNYWSNYNGADVYSGQYQNETGSDGIGDTPYPLVENSTDNYPLMGPWTMTGDNILSKFSTGASIAFQEVTAGGMTTFNTQTSPDAPLGSRPVGSCCNISTKAEYSGNVRVTLPYDPTNMTQMEEKVLRMMQWDETTLRWTNITTNVDTELNKITGQTTHLSLFAVMWRLGGDVNGDFTVDIYDAILLAGSYKTTPQSPFWNGNADMNNDNAIDIYDAIILAANYERTA
jgi:parallel beta-helix repeat protein